MSFAREGIPFATAGLLLAGLAWTGALNRPDSLALRGTAVGLSVLALFVLWFFRDPTPAAVDAADAVVAPGQGKVIGIDRVDEPTYVGGPAHKISIFLSVFDVHVQRAPVSGTVEQKLYRPGAYAVAWADKASDDNEQASLGISTENGRVLVRQIAGLVARRIITDPEEGDQVVRGRRFGLIRFGSRVDLFMPESWEIACSVGDRVRVGATVLAHQRASGESETGTGAAADLEASPTHASSDGSASEELG